MGRKPYLWATKAERDKEMKTNEITYYILDACKNISDDSIINEGHVLFLLKKYRSYLIKREQESKKGSEVMASEFEEQQICLDMEKTAAIDGEPCTGGYYLRSKQKIPKLMDGAVTRVYPVDYYQGVNVVMVSRERMRYVGSNKWLKNVIYVSIGPDLHLYMNSSNPLFKYMKKARMTGVFEDWDEAEEMSCDADGEDTSCDVMEREFPIRDYLVPQLIEMTEKEILGTLYRPKDPANNATDDLADIMAYVRRNMKSDAARQIEGPYEGNG